MPPRPNRLFGRADLLASVEQRLVTGGGVVLGPDGIGKSTLLDSVAATATARGELVVRLSPGETEQWLPDAGLADLLEQVPPGAMTALPAPQRAAVEALLQRSDPGGAGTPLARRLAVRAVLERCARQRPVLLLVDDAQWLDPGSADVLAYAMRRVTGRRIRAVAAERAPLRNARPGAVGKSVGVAAASAGVARYRASPPAKLAWPPPKSTSHSRRRPQREYPHCGRRACPPLGAHVWGRRARSGGS